jgi:hypothetical protein
MKKTLSTLGLGAALSVALLAGTAHAQHAKFVLFGDPAEGGANQPKEERFVHPVTAPFFHENSFVTSDARAWFIYHDFPDDVLIGGGDAYAGALQLRLAITNQIQFVAYKDGFINFDTPLVDDSGWFDVGAGLKWNFWQDWENNFHAAIGAGYEFPWGDAKVLQNDDEIRFWASVDKGFGKLHLGGTLNFFIPPGNDDSGLGENDRLSWHVHADYWVCEWFSPVVEFNGYHIIDGDDSPLDFQGIDVGNFGSDDPVVTVGLGFEVRPLEPLALRTAFELPLTSEDDLYGWRLTASVVFSF